MFLEDRYMYDVDVFVTDINLAISRGDNTIVTFASNAAITDHYPFF